MSKRKGVSAEEKRTRLLQLFHEKREFFQLKEIEKLAPKEKGIVAQAVKEVLQSLVDDSLVDTDKIGTSIYFWAFPSKTKQDMERRLESLRTELQESTEKLQVAQTKLEELTRAKEEEEGQGHAELKAALSQLEQLRLQHNTQQARLLQMNARPQAMKADTQLMRAATNRWTDNIFSTRAWCMQRLGAGQDNFHKQFGVPADMDYVQE